MSTDDEAFIGICLGVSAAGIVLNAINSHWLRVVLLALFFLLMLMLVRKSK